MAEALEQPTGRAVLLDEDARVLALDAIEFPKELLQEGDLAFAVGVTYYRAKGGAWGQYAVLFVVVKMATSTKV